MSQENVENLRGLWEAWNRGEFDLSLFDPEVTYEDTILPDHVEEIYRGHEGVIRATQRWLEPYEQLRIELDEIVGSGDTLVSIHTASGKAHHSGIEMEIRYAYLWTFRDGKIIHMISLRDPREALEAAGLSE